MQTDTMAVTKTAQDMFADTGTRSVYAYGVRSGGQNTLCFGAVPTDVPFSLGF